MTELQQIESDIKALSREESRALRRCLMEHDAAACNDQIAADLGAGKFGRMAEAALAEHRAGRSRAL